MSITAAEFKVRFTEFAAEADARVNTMIGRAELHVNEGVWGAWYNEGLYYLSAHFLAVARRATASGTGLVVSGALTSKSVGDVSVSFAATTPTSVSEGYYNSTSYGAEFWAMAMVVGTQLGVVEWTDG